MLLSSILSDYVARFTASLKLHNASSGDQTNVCVENVGCNSKEIEKNWMFCCIAGEHKDGHDFAGEAIRKGASILMTERPLPLDIPQIISTDVRREMGRLASIVYGEPARKLKMFAVTGTNGKSTTTWIIRHLLESLGIRTGLIGTIVYNDGITEEDAGRTTPESCDIQRMLAHMLRNGCEACVMETSSHGLCFGRIEGCLFDAAVFTNLSEEHLDYHGTLENYFSAKSRLFSDYTKKSWSGGANVDDPFARRLLQLYPDRLVAFGTEDELKASLSGSDIQSTLQGTRFSVSIPGETRSLPVTLPLPGKFNVYNALAALSVTLPQAADRAMLIEALRTMVQVPGRMETYTFDNGVSGIIDFAHTPVALENVLTEVRRLCSGRVISVFGHGGERFQPNRYSLGSIAAALADEVIVTMDNPRNEPAEQIAAQIVEGVASSKRKIPLKTILDRTTAVHEAMDSAEPGDVVVISGKGPEKYLRIGSESVPYSDGDALRTWANERGVGWR